MLLLTGKAVFISILVGIFFWYFGYPSYVKYQSHETIFTESRVKFDARKPVGITVFPWRNTMLSGWKKNVEELGDLRKMCNESADFDKVVQCINNGTFTHSDSIEKYTKEDENETETDVNKGH
eukprot:TRINITY_DN32990_c0_g1_i1.p1 TRINITY_DN32990_c0_g1~~TRINITY_DN32990_c0_g1_i1.p1  ORF type:complete len:123 (-),score=22.43 TRINITY_DN32990_c0_g1_i1:130-498(-)